MIKVFKMIMIMAINDNSIIMIIEDDNDNNDY